MIIRYKFLLPLLLLLFSTVIYGQKINKNEVPCLEELPEECVSLICDRDYYLSGDQLWFKAFVFVDGELSSAWSKVLYVELYNSDQDVIYQEKYWLEEGMTDGVVQIPEDVNTGNYFLRAYTQYGRNYPVESLFTKVLSIVNPLSEDTYIKVSKDDEVPGITGARLTTFEKPIQLQLSLTKKNFNRREKVTLEIDKHAYAELLVSVRKKGTAHSMTDVNGFVTTNPWLASSYAKIGIDQELLVPFSKDKMSTIKLDWIPEIRGLTLSGKILNKKTGKPAQDVYCITSVIEKEPQIHMAKTDANGMFVFSCGQLRGEKDFFVAIRNNPDRDLTIHINNDFSTSFPEMIPMPFPFDYFRHLLFEELFISRQLNKTFVSSFLEDAYAVQRPLSLPFNIGAPDIILDVNEFIYIPNMTEIFRELVPTVSVRGKIGSRKLNVFDRESFRDLDNPLVLLDNVPVSDIESLLQIEPRQLDAIEVYNSEYLLGDYTFGGIVSLKSNTNDFAGFKWTDNSVFLKYKSLQERNVFRHPVYLSENAYQDKKPDFRPLLYWNPEVRLLGKPLELTFFTSDHISEYEIVVSGYNKEGKFCYGSIDFEVVE